MGLFQKLFGPLRRPISRKDISEYFETLTAYAPSFHSYGGSLYEMQQTRQAIHAIATHASKLKPHATGSRGKTIERQLQFKMNPWQTTSQFLARTATILFTENTCFLIPVLNQKGETVGAFPILPSMTELVEAQGEIYLRFSFSNGETAAVEFSRCGVLVDMQYKNDFFGDDNKPILPTLELISMQEQGIVNGIKQAAAIRFLAQLSSSLRDEDIDRERKRFLEKNLSAENNGGAIVIDSKYKEVKQLESKPYIVDADQMKLINDNVEKYFGVGEKILKNEWDEAVWNAFYEGKIEPFALQLSLVLTGMFFNDHERAFGNEIMFSANRLQFASTSDKVKIITQLFDRGMLNQDEGREIMQMPPLPDGKGQKYYIRGEYQTKQENGGESNA